MTAERWLPVVGFEGVYEVSDLGRVRSLDRVTTHRQRLRSGDTRDIQVERPGVLLRPGLSSNGYLTVFIGGKSHCVNVLVLESFVGPCPAGEESCHNDGTRTNNTLSNLRWDTRKGNAADRRAHGTLIIGAANKRAKLNDDDAREIKRLRGVVPQSELADRFGVSPAAVQAVHDGRTWKHA